MSYHLRILALSRAIIALFTLGGAPCVGAVGEPLTGVDSPPTAIDVKCRDRFLKEAGPAWKELRERLRGVEIALTYDDHWLDLDGKPASSQRTSTYCVLKDGVSRRLDRTEKIDITNNRYSFEVLRSDTIYTLSECELWRQGTQQPLAGWLDIAQMNLDMVSNIWWLPIEKILANEQFQMTGAQCGVNSAGDEIVRIAYRYTGAASMSDVNLQPDGVYWAELLPARFWIVLQSGIITSMTKYSAEEAPFQARVTTRYQEWDRAPLPEEVRIELVDLRKKVVVRVQENRFGPPMSCTRSSEEFFLPFYGLSETSIPQMEGGFSYRRLGIIATGIVSMVLAWLLYKRSKVVAARIKV